jgi:hypothetical protein
VTASGRRRGERLGLHQAGNAINSATVQVGKVAGPLLGGLLVATGGPAPAFAVDAASFAASAASLALIRPSRPAARAAQGAAAAETGTADTEAADTVPAPTATEASWRHRAAVGSAGVWALRRQARLLQVIIVAANLAGGGTFEVALPALAHARFGPGGYGALIACLGSGAVIGTLAAALSIKADRPAVPACACYLIEAVAIAFVPFLGAWPERRWPRSCLAAATAWAT